ncbi:MAG: hypothetical protein KF729_03220 [Sandaracinaceae bacterium]|nr:hypothetical protein [Sandaracinaceae bacterium]
MPRLPRSRHDLTRCLACRAHVRVAPDAACPLCEAPLGAAASARPFGRGGLLAAALLAFGATACGAGSDGGADEPVAEDTSGEDTSGDERAGGDDGRDGEPGGGGVEGDPEDAPVVALYGVPPGRE